MNPAEEAIADLAKMMEGKSSEGRSRIIVQMCKVAVERSATLDQFRDHLWRLFIMLMSVRKFPFVLLQEFGCPQRALYFQSFANADDFAEAIKAWDGVQKTRW